MRRRAAPFWLLAIAALAVAVVLGVAAGAVPLSPVAVARALAGRGDTVTVSIVRALRLPRVVTAALVGAGLGVSGAALQGALRNALAEPYLLGVSGGAAVGAVVATVLGVGGAIATPLAGFGGAAVAVALVLGVAGAAGARGDPRVLLMAGVVVGALANAVVVVALAGAAPNEVRDAMWWMMGSVDDATWGGAGALAAYLAVGTLALLAIAREIDVLALGDDPAAALGVDVDRAGRRAYLVGSLVAAATVATAGLVGFVGLVVPHIVRAGGIRRHRALIVGSAIVGAALVVAADVVARTAHAPAELPLGAVTAIVGVPFLLFRLRAAR